MGYQQNIMVTMQQIKSQTDNMLNPRLVILNQAMSALPPDSKVFHDLQQQKNVVLQQINKNKLQCHELQNIQNQRNVFLFTKILRTLKPETFQNVLSETINVIQQSQSKKRMEETIGLILQFSVQNPLFIDQYVHLCAELRNQNNLKFTNWKSDDDDTSKMITEIIVNQARKLFLQYSENKDNDKKKYIE